MTVASQKTPRWRDLLYTTIFEAETPAGKWFDILLIVSILISVATVMLDSVASLNARYSTLFYTLEWFFTIIFTIEYILRLICVGRPLVYAASFFGLVDLLAIIPTYISLFIPGTKYLLVIRVLRILRIFRVLKLVQYMGEAVFLLRALRASSRKITLFLSVRRLGRRELNGARAHIFALAFFRPLQPVKNLDKPSASMCFPRPPCSK